MQNEETKTCLHCDVSSEASAKQEASALRPSEALSEGGKQCQNCKTNFFIALEDFVFYKKIEVPPPTFCPDCRLIRRLSWRNERTLYHGTCKATGKNVITMFSPESNMTIYERNYFWGDEWDGGISARDYDFNKPFFEQFQMLLHAAPLPNVANSNNLNSEYVNHSQECKDCYLVYASHKNENVMYSAGALDCKDSLDLYNVSRAEKSYHNTLCADISRVLFGTNTEASLDSAFTDSCRNVANVFGCVNLRNKQHALWNVLYTKEEYEKKRNEIDLGSYTELKKIKSRFAEMVKEYPKKYAAISKSSNVTGDNIITSKNCAACFDLYGSVEDSKFLIHGLEARDCYDMYGFGLNIELLYEGIDTGINASRCMGNVFTHGCRNASYTYCCHNSSNIFGCVGLRNKEYCILNKQYSKEEYEALVPKIIEHMNVIPYEDEKGNAFRYGEFFPTEISPFCYNESIAQEYFPLSEKEAKERGYRWRTAEEKHYNITLTPQELPDHIKNTPDSITREIIQCEHDGKCNHQCTKAFKIIPKELEFLRDASIALPRMCSNCRHYEHLAHRTPFKVWKRQCQCSGEVSESEKYRNTSTHAHGKGQCNKEFETTYAPGRPEIVYCEPCYQMEIL